MTASISPLSKDKLMRDAAINLRARPEQRDLIDHAAQLLGKNRSDFMREAACDKARSVLLDHVFLAWTMPSFKALSRCSMRPWHPMWGWSG
jgi:uncharacterized protein (DUF1778 family)